MDISEIDSLHSECIKEVDLLSSQLDAEATKLANLETISRRIARNEGVCQLDMEALIDIHPELSEKIDPLLFTAKPSTAFMEISQEGLIDGIAKAVAWVIRTIAKVIGGIINAVYTFVTKVFSFIFRLDSSTGNGSSGGGGGGSSKAKVKTITETIKAAKGIDANALLSDYVELTKPMVRTELSNSIGNTSDEFLEQVLDGKIDLNSLAKDLSHLADTLSPTADIMKAYNNTMDILAQKAGKIKTVKQLEGFFDIVRNNFTKNKSTLYNLSTLCYLPKFIYAMETEVDLNSWYFKNIIPEDNLKVKSNKIILDPVEKMPHLLTADDHDLVEDKGTTKFLSIAKFNEYFSGTAGDKVLDSITEQVVSDKEVHIFDESVIGFRGLVSVAKRFSNEEAKVKEAYDKFPDPDKLSKGIGKAVNNLKSDVVYYTTEAGEEITTTAAIGTIVGPPPSGMNAVAWAKLVENGVKQCQLITADVASSLGKIVNVSAALTKARGKALDRNITVLQGVVGTLTKEVTRCSVTEGDVSKILILSEDDKGLRFRAELDGTTGKLTTGMDEYSLALPDSHRTEMGKEAIDEHNKRVVVK